MVCRECWSRVYCINFAALSTNRCSGHRHAPNPDAGILRPRPANAVLAVGTGLSALFSAQICSSPSVSKAYMHSTRSLTSQLDYTAREICSIDVVFSSITLDEAVWPAAVCPEMTDALLAPPT